MPSPSEIVRTNELAAAFRRLSETRRADFSLALGASHAVETTSLYQYSALGDNQIRILTIECGSIPDPLALRLEVASLTDPNIYTALSYAWGSQDATLKVLVDGKILKVTPTVHQALLRLRKDVSNVRVWIDAICINQTDIQEKTVQIPLMRDIYTKCESVTVWLGEEDEDTVSVTKAVRELSALQNEFNKGIPHDFDFSGIMQRLPLNALGNFFHRSWFSRLWVLQEFVLAPTAVIVVGSCYVSSWDLYAAAYWLRFNCHVVLSLNIPQYIELYSSHYKYDFEREQHQHAFVLSSLLHRSRDRLASDPRDKVFGILGLASDALGIGVNYTRTKVELFTDVARRILLKHDDLRALGWAGGVEGGPSWVPDWSVAWSCHPIERMLDGEYYPAYKASLSTKPRINWTRGGVQELVLEGRLADVVEKICSHEIPTQLVDDGRHHLEDFVSSICSSLSLHGIYPFTEEAYEKAWMRNLMADSYLDSTRYENWNDTFFPAGLKREELRNNCPEELVRKAEEEILQRAGSIAWGRRMFVSKKGYIGILPETAQIGDLLCLLLGGTVLYILRPTEEDGKYRLIGDCYVHGLMDGEALEGIDLETEEFETFTLV